MMVLVLIKGAGDIATGCALRLWRCGFDVVMTELSQPSSIRRTVCFSEAARLGETEVEGVKARLAGNAREAVELLHAGILPVLRDEECLCREELRPDVLVDAILAKHNTGTRITDAPGVVGVGPGFTAGEDVHAVVETQRGHTLGRVIWEGSAIANTGVPGNIGGFTVERVMHSTCPGTFHALHAIGDTVRAGEPFALIGGEEQLCKIDGTLRGILPEGFMVPKAGFKCGDVDPRCRLFHCYTASDKAQAVGGGVLEAVIMLTSLAGAPRKPSERMLRYLADHQG